MDQRLMVALEVHKNDKIFTYNMPFGATYQDAYDATVEFGQFIVEMSKKTEAAQKEKSIESKTE